MICELWMHIPYTMICECRLHVFMTDQWCCLFLIIENEVKFHFNQMFNFSTMSQIVYDHVIFSRICHLSHAINILDKLLFSEFYVFRINIEEHEYSWLKKKSFVNGTLFCSSLFAQKCSPFWKVLCIKWL